MKQKIILGLIISIIFLSACKKDFLDREPLDAYSNSSLWTSASDATAALNGVYSGEYDNFSWSNGPGWADGTVPIYFDCLSDNAYSQYSWEGFQAFGNGSATALTTGYYAADLWDYTTVQKCNFFLANIGPTPMDSSTKANMIAQVRFIRAYRYFLMDFLYGGVPLVTQSLTAGQADQSVRVSQDTITNFILSELAGAAPNLSTSITTDGHITKGAAIALKARVELFIGDYADCITDCQTLMGMGYSLFPSYSDLFRIQNEDNSEVILDVQYIENPYANSTYVYAVMPSNSMGGQSSICPLQSLVDAYEMSNGKVITDPTSGYDSTNPYKNRDPRLAATILYPGGSYIASGNTSPSYYDPVDASSPDYYATGNNTSPTGYLVKKYTANLNDFDNLYQGGLNTILIRYAEVLLTYAEAKIESNQIDGSVYAAINAVRQRAGMPAVDQSAYNSQATLRTLIRRERRVELAMEGLRWYDIQRWKIGPQVMPGPVWGAKIGTVNTSTGQYTITGSHLPTVETRQFVDPKNYLWPVPQAEININNELVQNPGY